MRAIKILSIISLALITVAISAGCSLPLPFIDYFYKISVENRLSRPVEVFVNGKRQGYNGEVLGPCSQQSYTSSFYPDDPLVIEVRDLQGNTVLKTEEVADDKNDGEFFVIVPGASQDECMQITVVPTPTPPWNDPDWLK